MGEAASVHPRRALEAYCRLTGATLSITWSRTGTWIVSITAAGDPTIVSDPDLDAAYRGLCLLAFDAMLTDQAQVKTDVGSPAWPDDPYAWLDGDDIRVRCPDALPRRFEGETILGIYRHERHLEVRFTSLVTGKPATTSVGPYPTVGCAEWAHDQAYQAWQQWKAAQDTPRWAYATEGKLQIRHPSGGAGFFCDEIKRISRDNRVLVVEYQTRGGPPDRWSSGIYATVADAATAYNQASDAWIDWRHAKASPLTDQAVAPDARAWVDLNGFLHIVSGGRLHSTFEVSGINSLLPAGRGIAVNFGDPAVTSHLDFDTQEHADAALNDARDALDAWEAR